MKTLKFSLLTVLIMGNGVFYGNCQNKEKNIDETLKQCRQLLDKDDLNAAAKCYGEAVIANPESSEEISEAGRVEFFKKCNHYWRSENYEKSIICYEGAQVIDPNNTDLLFPLADSYYEYYKLLKNKNSDLLKKAEEAVKSYLKLKPEDPSPHGLYGSILKENKDWTGAEKEYKEMLKLDPKAGYFWVLLAYVQEQTGKRKEAIQSCEQSLIIDPNDVDSLYVLGNIYSRSGETDKAVNTFERLLKIKPDYEDIAQRLENLKKAQKDKKTSKSKTKTAGNC